MIDLNNLCVKIHTLRESNGKTTYMVALSLGGNAWDDYEVFSSDSKGRADYTADELRHFLGQGEKPYILDYNTED